jgi:hypothetical protein
MSIRRPIVLAVATLAAAAAAPAAAAPTLPNVDLRYIGPTKVRTPYPGAAKRQVWGLTLVNLGPGPLRLGHFDAKLRPDPGAPVNAAGYDFLLEVSQQLYNTEAVGARARAEARHVARGLAPFGAVPSIIRCGGRLCQTVFPAVGTGPHVPVEIAEGTGFTLAGTWAMIGSSSLLADIDLTVVDRRFARSTMRSFTKALLVKVPGTGRVSDATGFDNARVPRSVRRGARLRVPFTLIHRPRVFQARLKKGARTFGRTFRARPRGRGRYVLSLRVAPKIQPGRYVLSVISDGERFRFPIRVTS